MAASTAGAIVMDTHQDHVFATIVRLTRENDEFDRKVREQQRAYEATQMQIRLAWMRYELEMQMAFAGVFSGVLRP